MNLLMAATPLAMQVCGIPFADAALVLEWHVIGMFAPGFFTGHLIKTFGVMTIMGVGVLLNLACIAWRCPASTCTSSSWRCSCSAWAGTSCSPAAPRWRCSLPPEEKDKAQAAINFCVFATMAFTSFASGALVTTQGWTLLNLGSLLPVTLTGVHGSGPARMRRSAANSSARCSGATRWANWLPSSA
jgi:hypothetical protein